jgi:hypothetical protein
MNKKIILFGFVFFILLINISFADNCQPLTTNFCDNNYLWISALSGTIIDNSNNYSIINNGVSINDNKMIFNKAQSDNIKITTTFRTSDNTGSIIYSGKLNSKDDYQNIFSYSASNSNNPVLNFQFNSDNKLYIYARSSAGGTTSVTYTTETYDQNTDYHIVLTSSGSAYKLYVNNVSQTLNGVNNGFWFNDVGTTYTMQTYLGVTTQGGFFSYFLDSDVDYISYYSSELTHSQVSELFTLGKKYNPYISSKIIEITAKNIYDNSVITNFTAQITNTTTTTTISTTNGTIYYPKGQIVDIFINSTDYFLLNYYNISTNSSFEAELYQSVLILNATNEAGNIFLDFNSSIGSKTNSSNNKQATFYLNAGTYYINAKANGYIYNSSKTIQTAILETKYDTIVFAENQLNITAKYKLNDSIVTNFTAHIYKDGVTQSIVTTNGKVSFLGTMGLYSVTIEPDNILFGNTTETINLVNSSQLNTIYILERNSIFVTIYDANTLLKINKNIDYVVDALNGAYFLIGNTTNGTLYLDSLSADQYKFDFESGVSYPKQSYIVTLAHGESRFLNAYLVNSSFASDVVITIVNPYDQKIENATITIQEIILGSYVTVSQKKTDSTGRARFFLKEDTTYRAIIEANNYDYRIATITPISALYEVSLRIDPSISYSFTSSTYGVVYRIETYSDNDGGDVFLTSDLHWFNFTVLSSNGYLSWFAVKQAGNLTNITTSPAGGTTGLNLNLTDYEGDLTVEYMFQVTGQDTFKRNVTFKIVDIVFSNSSLYYGSSQFQTSMPFIWKILIIIGSVLVLIFVCFELGFPDESYAFVITGVTIFFSLPMIAWIPPVLSIVIGVLTISGVIISMSRGGKT